MDAFDRFEGLGGSGAGAPRGGFTWKGKPVGAGGAGGGKFRGGAVESFQGALPKTFVIRRLGLQQVSPRGDMGWVAHVENLPPGMQDVPLPYTSAMPLETVMRELSQMGHIIQIGD